MVSFAQPLYWQLRYLVTGLTKKNFKASASEIHHLVSLYGHDAQQFFLKTLLDEIDFKDAKCLGSRDGFKVQLLQQEVARLGSEKMFGAIVAQVMEATRDGISEDVLNSLVKVSKMPLVGALSLGAAGLNASSEASRKDSAKFLRAKLRELSSSPSALPLPDHLVHTLLAALSSPAIQVDDVEGKEIQDRDFFVQLLETNAEKVACCSPISAMARLQRAEQSKVVVSEDSRLASRLLDELGPAISACATPADLMEEVGYGSCSSAASVRTVLAQFPISTADVALILCMMARTRIGVDSNTLASAALHSYTTQSWREMDVGEQREDPNSWNVQNFIDVVREYSDVRWDLVLDHMDQAGVSVPDRAAFEFIVDTLKLALPGKALPTGPLLKEWSNVSAQHQLLQHALQSPPQTFDFRSCSPFEVPKECSRGPENGAWCSLDVWRVLLKTSGTDGYAAVRSMFDVALKACPEVVLIGACRMVPEGHGQLLTGELLAEVVPRCFIQGTPAAPAVREVVFKSAPGVCIAILSNMATRQGTSVKAVELTLSIPGLLRAVLDDKPGHLSFEVAEAASEQKQCSLPAWMSKQLSKYGDRAALGCVKFLRSRVQNGTQKPQRPLSSGQVVALVACMQDAAGQLSPETNRMVQQFASQAQAVYPEMSFATSPAIPAAPSAPPAAPPPALVAQAPRQPPAPLQPASPTAPSGAHVPKVAPTAATPHAPPPSQPPSPPAGAPPSPPAMSQPPSHPPTGPPSAPAPSPKGAAQVPLQPPPEAPQGPPPALPGTPPVADQALQDTANRLFATVFTGDRTVQELVEICKEYARQPPDSQEHKIYNAMIEILFAECKIFPKYGPKELSITGELFGSLIWHDLVPSNNVTTASLSLALRCVLEALRREKVSKMFRFGLLALEQFLPKLPELPPLCRMLQPLQHLKADYPTYHQYIVDILEALPKEFRESSQTLSPEQLKGLNLPKPPAIVQDSSDVARPSPPAVPPAPPQAPPPQPAGSAAEDASPGGQKFRRSGSPVHPPQASASSVLNAHGFNSSPQLDNLLNDPDLQPSAPQPPAWIGNQIGQVFNALVKDNVEDKAETVRGILTPEYHDWFAMYLVKSRVSKEVNLHNTYIEFLERIGNSTLINVVTNTTYDCLRVLLKSVDEAVVSTLHRTGLKNFGFWLGAITLARNKPLKARQLELKQLLLDAYKHGRLTAVLPLVCKILEGVQSSKVYKLPNPWTTAIMALLAEIHDIPNLRTNLMFEVEVLCKHLDIALKDLKRSEHLKKITPSNTNDLSHQGRAAVEAASKVASRTAVESLHKSEPVYGTSVADGNRDRHAEETFHRSVAVASPASDSADPHLPNLKISIPSHIAQMLQPNMRAAVPAAIDRAIREIITAVVERSVTISCLTTKEMVTKDFALEPEPDVVRQAAQYMVKSLAGSLARVTCREPLRISMTTHLKHALLNFKDTADAVVEQVLQILVDENLNMGCQVIEKTVIEKALRDVNESIAPAITARKTHRDSGIAVPFYDQQGVTQSANCKYPARLPENLRPKAGPLPYHCLKVYKDFNSLGGKTRDGPSPTGSPANPVASPTRHFASNLSTDSLRAFGDDGQVAAVAESSASAADPFHTFVSALPAVLSPIQDHIPMAFGVEINPVSVDPQIDCCTALMMMPTDHDLFEMLRALTSTAKSAPADQTNIFAMQIFKRLFEAMPAVSIAPETANTPSVANVHVEVHLAILDAIRKEHPGLPALLTSWLLKSGDDWRMCSDIVCALLRYDLVLCSDLDAAASKWIAELGVPAIEFVVEVIETCCVKQRFLMKQSFRLCADLLRNARSLPLSSDSPLHDALVNLTAMSPTHECSEAIRVDPSRALGTLKCLVGLKDRGQISDTGRDHRSIIAKFEDWHTAYLGTGSDVTSMHQSVHAMLTACGDESAEKFFWVSCEHAINSCQDSKQDREDKEQLNMSRVDAYARLVVLLMKFAEPHTTKVAALTQALHVISRTLLRSADEKKERFNQRPFYRLLLNLLIAVTTPDPQVEPIQFQLLAAFCTTFMTLSPKRVPSFAFAWLELISHRVFMPKLLNSTNHKGWLMFQRLLLQLLHFLEPSLRRVQLSEPIQVLYKGTLRVLLVLLHDFPEFLCDYHFSFCDVIPTPCVQIRNLILSAFPSSMKLPDPFMQNLKVDLLPEIKIAPRILTNYSATLMRRHLKADVDNYLRTREPRLLSDIQSKLLKEGYSGECKYDVSLMNALPLYLGIQIWQTNKQGVNMLHSQPPLTILAHLAQNLDSEGRYLFLSALANHLRYPNAHTHCFSCALLFLFLNETDIVKEQITRVLLERLIVHRPHPWGLLITFIELIKNRQFDFWNRPFVKCAPEVEKLFQCVATTCLVGHQQDVHGLSSVASSEEAA